MFLNIMVMILIPFFYINIIYIPSQRCCANDFCIEKLLLASISAMVDVLKWETIG